MIEKKSIILAFCLIPVLFIGCGGETQDNVSQITSENYIKVAKSIYAKENGQSNHITIHTPIPGQEMDENTLYLKKLVNPRGTKVTQVEVAQDSAQLHIQMDNDNKYATITLSGDEDAKTKVDMKSFTVDQ